MLKFAVKLRDKQLVGLGFCEGNFERLKAGKPIKISYDDLRLPGGGFVVAYPSDEVERLTSRMPKGWGIVKLGDEAMNGMRAGRHFRFPVPNHCEVLMFWGKDEDDLRRIVAPLVGPDTEDASPFISDGQHRARISR